jgi:hypothetical protein
VGASKSGSQPGGQPGGVHVHQGVSHACAHHRGGAVVRGLAPAQEAEGGVDVSAANGKGSVSGPEPRCTGCGAAGERKPGAGVLQAPHKAVLLTGTGGAAAAFTQHTAQARSQGCCSCVYVLGKLPGHVYPPLAEGDLVGLDLVLMGGHPTTPPVAQRGQQQAGSISRSTACMC